MGMMALAEAVNVLGVKRSLIIGKTYDDFANLIVTGGSGIGILPEPPEVRWRPPSLRWPNGAITYFKSADSPGGTYGSSVGFIWMDECADYPTRKGRCIWDDVTHIASESKPLILATTSPYERGASIGRVAALVKQEGPDVKVTRGTSFENTALSPAYFELQKRQHDGKRAFESMVMGEILDALQGAIWSGAHIRGARLALTPAMRKRLIARCDRIVVAVDPAGVASAEGSATGVVVAGRVRKRNGRHHAFVFESLALRSRAEDWALDVARLYGEYGADIVIAERNQGGMYIEGDIAGGARAAGVSLRYQSIVSRGGKGERAMPFRARYQDGLVHHVVEGKWGEARGREVAHTGERARGGASRAVGGGDAGVDGPGGESRAERRGGRAGVRASASA